MLYLQNTKFRGFVSDRGGVLIQQYSVGSPCKGPVILLRYKLLYFYISPAIMSQAPQCIYIHAILDYSRQLLSQYNERIPESNDHVLLKFDPRVTIWKLALKQIVHVCFLLIDRSKSITQSHLLGITHRCKKGAVLQKRVL